MKKYKSVEDFFNTKGPEDAERFIDKNLDISQQVYALIKEKGWSQKEFAKELGKTDAEISKWLSGMHNLTLRSIAKMEAALGADIIETPLKAEKRYKKVEYVKFKVYANPNKILPDSFNYKEAEQDISKKDNTLKIQVA